MIMRIKVLLSLSFFFLSFNFYAQALKLDALVLYRQGKYEDAVKITLGEIKQNPASLNSYIVLSWSLLKLKRYSEALNYGNKALKLKSNDYRVLFILGEASFYLKNNSESRAYFLSYLSFSKAIKNRRLDLVYYYVVMTYIREKNLNKADFLASYALFLFPKDFRLNLIKAMLLETEGDFKSSANYYKTALKIRPTFKISKLGLERVLK